MSGKRAMHHNVTKFQAAGCSGWRNGLLAAAMSCVLFCFDSNAERVSVMGQAPDWSRLDAYQQTMTRETFLRLLNEIYAPDNAWRETIRVGESSARILTSRQTGAYYKLHFAADEASRKPAPGYWRSPAQLGPAPDNQPLRGLKIALDPGHIGGDYSQMEERWFQIGDDPPVTEGDMVLIVARLLEPRLKALGAQVVNIRPRAEPVTRRRPNHLRREAVAALEERGVTNYQETYQRGQRGAMNTVQWQSELLFYRVSEIRDRARLINQRVKPDVTLCLHFNAEPWGNAARPTLVDANHLHLLVNGCYSAAELNYRDQRFEMLLKMLNRSWEIEIPLSEEVARSMAAETGLPPYVYTGSHAKRVGSGRYVYARNLLANRLFECPVVYLEPYVMNNREVYARIQAGDYEGQRMVAGKMRPSIYREYVDGLVKGLVDYFSKSRPSGR